MTSCRLIPMPCASQGLNYVSTHFPSCKTNKSTSLPCPHLPFCKLLPPAICKLSIKQDLARLPASGLLAVGSICTTPLLFTTLFVGVLEVQGLTRLGTCTGQE